MSLFSGAVAAAPGQGASGSTSPRCAAIAAARVGLATGWRDFAEG